MRDMIASIRLERVDPVAGCSALVPYDADDPVIRQREFEPVDESESGFAAGPVPRPLSADSCRLVGRDEVTAAELAALVGQRFPGGEYTIAHWENALLTDCTERGPMAADLAHPIALFHVPIQGVGTSIGELFRARRGQWTSRFGHAAGVRLGVPASAARAVPLSRRWRHRQRRTHERSRRATDARRHCLLDRVVRTRTAGSPLASPTGGGSYDDRPTAGR